MNGAVLVRIMSRASAVVTVVSAISAFNLGTIESSFAVLSGLSFAVGISAIVLPFALEVFGVNIDVRG